MEYITREDFRKKYEGTYFMIEHRGKVLPQVFKHGDVEYAGDDADTLKLHAFEYIPSKGTGQLHTFNSSEIEIIPPPESKLVDYRGEVWHYTKNGQRQWKVGYCIQNTYVSSPLQVYMYKAFRESMIKNSQWVLVKEFCTLRREEQVNSDLLCQIFSDTKPCVNLSEAISSLGVDRLSRVLYETFWVSLSPNSNDEYFIFSFDVLVAKVVKNNISIINKKYRQEVLDYLKRSGSNNFNVL